MFSTPLRASVTNHLTRAGSFALSRWKKRRNSGTPQANSMWSVGSNKLSRPVLQGFGYMRGQDAGRTGKVGDGTGDFQDPVKAAC